MNQRSCHKISQGHSSSLQHLGDGNHTLTHNICNQTLFSGTSLKTGLDPIGATAYMKQVRFAPTVVRPNGIGNDLGSQNGYGKLPGVIP